MRSQRFIFDFFLKIASIFNEDQVEHHSIPPPLPGIDAARQPSPHHSTPGSRDISRREQEQIM